MAFDLDSAVMFKEDEAPAISTTSFDPASARPLPENHSAKTEPGIFSKFLRSVFKGSIIEQMNEQTFIGDKISSGALENIKRQPDESVESFTARFKDWNKKKDELVSLRDKEIAKEGVARQIEAPMMLAGGEFALAKPAMAAVTAAAFTVKDALFNARHFLESKNPNASENLKDFVEVVDLGLTGAAALKIGNLTTPEGRLALKNLFKNRLESIGHPTNILISPEKIAQIKADPKISPGLEKLGVEDRHAESSINNNVPVEVPAEKLVDLASESYWPRAKKVLSEPTPEELALQETKSMIDQLQKEKVSRETLHKENVAKIGESYRQRENQRTVEMASERDKFQSRVDQMNAWDTPEGKLSAIRAMDAPKDVKTRLMEIALENKKQSSASVQLKNDAESDALGLQIKDNPEAIKALEEDVRQRDVARDQLLNDPNISEEDLVKGLADLNVGRYRQALDTAKTGKLYNKAGQSEKIAQDDKADIKNLIDWEQNQAAGERTSFVNAEGQRQFTGNPSGHSKTMQEIGPKESFRLLEKARLGEKLTEKQQENVQALLKDYRDNIKQNLEGIGLGIKPPEPPKPNVVTPVEGGGETKVRTLAKGVEEKAIENRLTKGFGDLPEYQVVSMKEQAQRASDILSTDYAQAKRIAMGQEPPPQGVLPESVFVAVENQAIKESDVGTLMELATESNLTVEATTMGQRIRTLGERDPESPVAAIKSVKTAREKAVKEKNVPAEKNRIAKEIKKEIKKVAVPKETWESFIKSLEC